jgi:ABC-type antimicrobial peptide transport system ATPase subunit
MANQNYMPVDFDGLRTNLVDSFNRVADRINKGTHDGELTRGALSDLIDELGSMRNLLALLICLVEEDAGIQSLHDKVTFYDIDEI